MGDYSNVLYNLAYFMIFAALILIIATISLKIFTKKFSFTTHSSKMYGIFYNLTNRGIIALSLTSLAYLFLVWNSMMTQGLNWIYTSIIVLFPLVSLILVKNYIKIPLQLIISAINCFAIYIIHFAHVYLSGEVEDILMRIAIFFIIAFAFIYFTYNYFGDVFDIAKMDKKRVGGKIEN